MASPSDSLQQPNFGRDDAPLLVAPSPTAQATPLLVTARCALDARRSSLPYAMYVSCGNGPPPGVGAAQGSSNPILVLGCLLVLCGYWNRSVARRHDMPVGSSFSACSIVQHCLEGSRHGQWRALLPHPSHISQSQVLGTCSPAPTSLPSCLVPSIPPFFITYLVLFPPIAELRHSP
ncbi:hypothetical protein P280DRAFT_297407 [Massarina eburnea CBS 473.64]|uniref:Uncharacterized protein n=1 Tax=Massarina eburnea CBS 473.64 TaxID=1395130 RepID=A0A6A6RFX9_9PLEO|nr:hypothetical protein P280DRAFT_297407 [Massarina eburnea CBS 473.64]